MRTPHLASPSQTQLINEPSAASHPPGIRPPGSFQPTYPLTTQLIQLEAALRNSRGAWGAEWSTGPPPEDMAPVEYGPSTRGHGSSGVLVLHQRTWLQWSAGPPPEDMAPVKCWPYTRGHGWHDCTVCVLPWINHSTGQLGHKRGQFLRKDDSCDRILVIYIELFMWYTNVKD